MTGAFESPRKVVAVLCAVVVSVTAACGEQSSTDDTGGDDGATATVSVGSEGAAVGDGTGGPNVLTIDGESVTVGSTGCSIDHITSGGSDVEALFAGVDSSGRNLTLSVRRYIDGDEVRVEFDERSDAGERYENYVGVLDVGGVDIGDSTISAHDVTVEPLPGDGPLVVSFDLSC